MNNSKAFTIGIWVLWALAAAVVIGFGLYHLFFDDPPQGIMARATESLFAPISMILIGLSMRFDNARLQSLTATITVFSIILSIAFAWTVVAETPDNLTFRGTQTYFTEALAVGTGLVYLVVYLRRGAESAAR